MMQQRGIDRVVTRCYGTIRAVTKGHNAASSCVYEVPEFVLGCPVYDLTDCILFVKRHLESNGYKVYYIFPRILIVSWESAIESGRLLAAPSVDACQFNVKPSGKVVLSLI